MKGEGVRGERVKDGRMAGKGNWFRLLLLLLFKVSLRPVPVPPSFPGALTAFPFIPPVFPQALEKFPMSPLVFP